MPSVDAIRNLIQDGFNVIPLKPNSKEPALDSWKELQHRFVTEQEVNEWWGKYPQLGVAVVTGKISNIIVLDIDTKRGGSLNGYHVPETLTVITPSGGRHLYFHHPGGYVKNRHNLLPGVDLRGDRGFVVAPPTALFQGAYRWENPNAQIADAPEWLLALLQNIDEDNENEDDNWYKELLKGVPVGERDNAAIRLAGRWIRHGLSDEEVVEMLLAWNKKNKPPMGQHPGDPNELEWARIKVDSARRMEESRLAIKRRPEEIIKRLKEAESVQDKYHILEEFLSASQSLSPTEQEFFMEQARKAAGITKSALKSFIEKHTKKKDESSQPVPLDEPLGAVSNPSQDFYKGTFYYGVWLPVNPQARTADDFVFKFVTSDKQIIDPPEGMSVPTFQSSLVGRWSLDKQTPYNVFEWLESKREVNAKQLLDELTELFRKFVWYPNEDSPFILALWAMSTYLYTATGYTSYLTFIGTKRSGKSRTLDILEKLCFNASNMSQASAAAIARTIGAYQSTAIIDEADFTSSPVITQGGVDDRLALLLNSYQRGRLYTRIEGESMTAKSYDPYSPKAIASMNRMPDALLDRAIQIRVERALPKQITGDLVFLELDEYFQLLRNQLYFFGLTYAVQVASGSKKVLELLKERGVTDRERDIWLTLASVAYAIGGVPLLDRMVAYTKLNIEEKEAQDKNSYTAAVIWACKSLLLHKDDTEDEDLRPVPKTICKEGTWFTQNAIRRVVAQYLGIDIQQVSSARIGRELISTGIIDSSSQFTKRLWSRSYHYGETAYKLEEARVMDAVIRYKVDDTSQLFEGETA